MKKFLRVLAVLSAVALLQASAFAAINDENTTGDLTTEDIEPIAENQDATDNNDATDEATAINNPDTGAAGVAVAVAAVAALGAAVVVSRKKD